MHQQGTQHSCIDMQKMISDDSKDHDSDVKSGTKLQTQSPKRASLHNRPTPYEFDEFVPWMCLQFYCPNTVTIKRIIQEDYVKVALRRISNKSTKSNKSKPADSQNVFLSKQSSKTPEDDDSIQVITYYNLFGNLQEVAIVGCPFDINRLAMKIICIALPYHTTLFKLTIARGGLTALTLHEISKILPESYLTDICLDDTKVPQKNYAILLQKTSRLMNLSLNRCQIGDDVCKEIVSSIDVGTPGYTLRTLELSSNRITDKGALAFADLLRRNRQLLHLNLSGNRITDIGAFAILDSLKEFSMSYDEILNMKRNKSKYYRQKMALYSEYVQNTLIEKERYVRRKSVFRSKPFKSPMSGMNKTKSLVSKKSVKKMTESTMVDSFSIDREALENRGALEGRYSHPDLELQTREAIGEFQDPFDNDHVVVKNEHFYCMGNMFFCSLNLAYNNLSYLSLQKILSVLEYQSEVKRPIGSTGLLRITVQGNYIPRDCDDYAHIEMLLQSAINDQLPKQTVVSKKKDKGAKRSSKIF